MWKGANWSDSAMQPGTTLSKIVLKDTLERVNAEVDRRGAGWQKWRSRLVALFKTCSPPLKTGQSAKFCQSLYLSICPRQPVMTDQLNHSFCYESMSVCLYVRNSIWSSGNLLLLVRNRAEDFGWASRPIDVRTFNFFEKAPQAACPPISGKCNL